MSADASRLRLRSLRRRRDYRTVRLFLRQPRGPIGLTIAGIFLVVAIAAPIIATHLPTALVGESLAAPSSVFFFGTDNVGKDVFSAVVYGARPSLMVGILAATFSLTMGTLAGAVAGYYGGARDAVIMRTAEVFQVLPSFILALVIVAMLGRGIGLTVIAIGITLWPQTARIVRAEVLKLKEQEYVASARAAGHTNMFILRSEIVPNAIPPAIIQATLDIGLAVLIEAGLSFLGLGDPTTPTWGELLNRAQPYLRTAWWLSVFPGVAIFMLVFSFNLIGDALNGALNPRMRHIAHARGALD